MIQSALEPSAPLLPAPPALGTDERSVSCPCGLAAVRAWARSRGYPVDESARVPEHVVQTYLRVHRAQWGVAPTSP